MKKSDQLEYENKAKGNSEDSLLVIYILHILKKYSSPKNPLSAQDVMVYLEKDYSIGIPDKANTQKKKVRRHLDTLNEYYWGSCIKKEEGKTRNGHKWYYDVSKDTSAREGRVIHETLTKEELDFIIDIITSSKIINFESTHTIVNKLLKKAKYNAEDIRKRWRKIEKEDWPKSINDELASIHDTIESCRYENRKIKFDYEDKKSITAIPYGWDSDKSGKYILIAKIDGARKGEFISFSLEKIQNLEKADFNYSKFDDTYFDRAHGRPDVLSMESLFSNIRIITAAIEKKRGLAFKYLSYVIRDDQVVVDGKGKRVLPHQLVFNDGKYYLIGYDEEQTKIDYYRVDLISNLDYSDTEIEISVWNERVLGEIERAREVEKHPLMMSGIDVPVIFKVAESALDRVIDAFAVNPDKFVVTNETRAVKDSFGEDYHDERIVKVQIRTTLEEAYRWALANADAVEIVTQDIRDKIARIADPIYQLYTQSLSDKVRENIDYVLKEGTFKITSLVDADTAYSTYKELAIRRCLGVVDTMGIAGEDDFDNVDYFGAFINTNRLLIKAPNLKNMSWASKLVNVEDLSLEVSQVEDLSWMKEMTKLKRLYLSESSVSDLSVLREHKEICDLDICGTNVSDISFIEKFPKLEHLHIASCPIEDYSPLFTTQSHLKYLEIDKRALEEIGEENIRNHHIGITIKTTNDLFYWL